MLTREQQLGYFNWSPLAAELQVYADSFLSVCIRPIQSDTQRLNCCIMFHRTAPVCIKWYLKEPDGQGGLVLPGNSNIFV